MAKSVGVPVRPLATPTHMSNASFNPRIPDAGIQQPRTSASFRQRLHSIYAHQIERNNGNAIHSANTSGVATPKKMSADRSIDVTNVCPSCLLTIDYTFLHPYIYTPSTECQTYTQEISRKSLAVFESSGERSILQRICNSTENPSD